jgi:hypothetical protein
MNKKGLSILILEIIGGVIVVAFMMTMFAGFSSPFLQFLIDQENIKSFNKYTNLMSTACSSGSGTELYFGPSPISKNEPYVWTLLYYRTARAISNAPDDTLNPGMQVCTTSSGTSLCTTQDSKDIIKRCKSDFCWCLLRIKLQNNKCYNDGYQMITIPTGDISKQDASLDANQPAYNGQADIYLDNLGVQLFKPITDGVISSIELHGYYNNYKTCSSSNRGKLQVSILGVNYDTPNYDDVLGTAEVSPSDISGSPAKAFTVKFSGVYVTKIDKYAIVVSAPESTATCDFRWSRADYNAYTDGASYVGKEDSWGSDTSKDFYFKFYIKPLASYSKLNSWDAQLAGALTNSNNVNKVRVIQCETIKDQMKCDKDNLPILPTLPVKKGSSEKRFIALIQPRLKWQDSIFTEFRNILPSKLFFDSFSADRPIIQSGLQAGEFDYYLNAYPAASFSTNFHDTGTGDAPIAESCRW